MAHDRTTDAQPSPPPVQISIPMVLHCPDCGARHVDTGDWAKRVHHTHACQECGFTWRPAVVPTVGVQFLPGFKNGVPAPEVRTTLDLWRDLDASERELADAHRVLDEVREILSGVATGPVIQDAARDLVKRTESVILLEQRVTRARYTLGNELFALLKTKEQKATLQGVLELLQT